MKLNCSPWMGALTVNLAGQWGLASRALRLWDSLKDAKGVNGKSRWRGPCPELADGITWVRSAALWLARG